MKYFYTNARAPKDSPIHEINEAAKRLHSKLIKLDPKELDISEYNQRFLSKKTENLLGVLQLYTHMLALSLSGNKILLSDFVFVDYGGGSGVLSLLAKELGIGKVIYNDIYNVSCDDIKILSKEIDIELDEIVCGDIDSLIEYVHDESIIINAICSYDVIEHIYDMKDYLQKLCLLSEQTFRVAFGSGANIKNPLIAKRLSALHLRVENNDKEDKWGRKKRDSIKSYLQLRKEIIKEYDPSITEDEASSLAHLTRGLIKEDILNSVREYKNNNGKITFTPDHPTNTCDPMTGNWAEHLMETNWLKQILEKKGFKVRILSGYHANTNNKKHRFIKNNLNLLISILRRNGLPISPYYVIYADYTAK